mgnify:CR=1 FL=1
MEVLKQQAHLEGQIELEPNCVIGVGYTVCTDVSFKVVPFFDQLDDQIKELETIHEK